MMVNPKVKDITGTRNGRLTVLEFVGIAPGRHAIWKCVCDCGVVKNIQGRTLKPNQTVSCGCRRDEHILTRMTTHGLTDTGAHKSWSHMMTRCFNPNREQYLDYSGRGITVCDRWKSFENFHQDMGDRPEGLTLDRIDVDGNYEPGNCRWITTAEQNRNQRRHKNGNKS